MHPTPLIEPDRFFAGPRSGRTRRGDAQTVAVARLVGRCAELRSHLGSLEALEAFIAAQPDPVRARKRISLALAIELGTEDIAYGYAGPAELEAFRGLAQRRPASVVWVFL